MGGLKKPCDPVGAYSIAYRGGNFNWGSEKSVTEHGGKGKLGGGQMGGDRKNKKPPQRKVQEDPKSESINFRKAPGKTIERTNRI